jgi:hypothetical protein
VEKYKRNLDAIDHTQNRYNDHNKIHIHPYDPQVLEKVREDFLLPRTCKEFIDWVDTHPHYDVVAEASSQYIRGTDRSEAFWQCANIQADWQSINDKITKYCLDNEIDTKFDTDYTEEWRIYDMKDQNTYVPFRHNSELDNQRKHGFKKQYQLIEVTLTDHFAELKDIEQLFEFDWAKTDINYQPTSGAFPRHVDFLTTAFKRAVEFDERIANAKYNPLTKCPEGWVLKRILIPTDSWYPGQMFSFEEHFWTDWKPGQVIDFNWAHCRHATANSGYSPRPLIKITGLVKESHWLAKGEWRDFVL